MQYLYSKNMNITFIEPKKNNVNENLNTGQPDWSCNVCLCPSG